MSASSESVIATGIGQNQPVEQELWNIFTFYSLAGAATDPEHMRALQFVKFARDIGLFGPDALSEANPPLMEADVNVAYTAEVRRRNRVGIQRMNYNDFLTALMKLSVRVYPHSTSVDDAFQRLLIQNVLPCAWRRNVEPVDDILHDPDVERLFTYFGDALEQIFQFYATSSDVAAHGDTSPSTTRRTMNSSFTYTGRKPQMNSMKCALGYPEFLKFASDFDLANSVILSTRELGDVYLSSIRNIEPDAIMRKLSFDEFWESLVRCSVRAYSKISHATALDRIRGLFLYMWRAITRSVPRAFTHRQAVTTYAGDLLSGAMLFNKRFTAMWAEDNYRDYLSPQSAQPESGKDVLARLTQRDAGGIAALTAALPDLNATYMGQPQLNNSPTNVHTPTSIETAKNTNNGPPGAGTILREKKDSSNQLYGLSTLDGNGMYTAKENRWNSTEKQVSPSALATKPSNHTMDKSMMSDNRNEKQGNFYTKRSMERYSDKLNTPKIGTGYSISSPSNQSTISYDFNPTNQSIINKRKDHQIVRSRSNSSIKAPPPPPGAPPASAHISAVAGSGTKPTTIPGTDIGLNEQSNHAGNNISPIATPGTNGGFNGAMSTSDFYKRDTIGTTRVL